MKKTILAMLLVGSSCAVFAQNDSVNRNTGTNNGSNTSGTSNSTMRSGDSSMRSGTTNGTMNGTTNGTMNGTTNGTMNGSTNGTMNGSTNGTWNNGTNGTNGNGTNGTMNGSSTNGTTNGYNTNGTMNGNLNSNNSYNAYGNFMATPPDYVSSYVTRDYPMASDVRWQQSADWWHGYYMNNNQPTNVYYNSSGQSFTVSLPVHQTLVPDDVVSRAVQTFGPTLYDVTAVKGSNMQDIYLIRTIDNGQLSSQWIDQSGNKVIDVYRTDNTNNSAMGNSMNSGSDMGNGQMNSTMSSDTNSAMDNSMQGKVKIKTKDSKGKVSKTKMVNGKVVKDQ